MSLAAAQVRARETSLESNIPGAFKCDPTWHKRGHYSNQGFGAAIDIVSNKVLEQQRANQPGEYAAFCLSINPTAQQTVWDKPRNGGVQQLWKYGKDM